MIADPRRQLHQDMFGRLDGVEVVTTTSRTGKFRIPDRKQLQWFSDFLQAGRSDRAKIGSVGD
jgi:hypothetical protein